MYYTNIIFQVTQYSCDYDNLAPSGCTQYHFGSDTSTIQTYNFAGGQHLASQNQNICIRQERGQCRICYWTTTAITDFVLSSKTSKMSAFVKSTICCGYGAAFDKTSG